MRFCSSALLLALSPVAVAPAAARPPLSLDRTEWARVSVHERILIRVPRRARLIARERARRGRIDRPVWTERDAPECVPITRLAGAAVSQGGDVDLMLVDGRRLRAKLARDCPSLDFYAGFYLQPNADGLICAGRDALRARSGGICPVARFRRLEPRR